MAGMWRRRPNDWRLSRNVTATSGSAETSEPVSDAFRILDHLSLGVLLVDSQQTVAWLNPAARQMMGVIEQPIGRLLFEVVRDHRLDALAQRARSSSHEQSLEIELPVSNRTVQVQAIPLQDQRVALLLVDMSRLRYLETVRQQFVANLSHEIRTPLAGLRLRAEIRDPDLQVLGDRAKTDQALQNIVDNALKFTREGEVVVGAGGDHGRVETTVRDTGAGIPPKDLPRIFERFYKVDRSRGGQPGSGLGLSIARHLIELQGGTITAESTPGVSTEVRVRLPRASLTSP